MFDCHSFLERKNPLAVIDSFRKAFGRSRDVVLVLKCSHASEAQKALLQDASDGANVILLDQVLTREQTNSLLSHCDCYVSLHRSEGFGLTMAEAMSLEKPVIATSYSGNMDFMSAHNAYLVKHRLVALEADYGPYKKGNVWADPDVQHASEMMRLVWENQAAAKETGRLAAEDVRRLLHPATVGELMQRRLDLK